MINKNDLLGFMLEACTGNRERFLDFAVNDERLAQLLIV